MNDNLFSDPMDPAVATRALMSEDLQRRVTSFEQMVVRLPHLILDEYYAVKSLFEKELPNRDFDVVLGEHTDCMNKTNFKMLTVWC